MIKYEVGAPFPQPNEVPGVERCITQIVGGNFDVLYYIKGASASDVATFKNAFLRFHIWIHEDIPFMAVSYAGSPWTYDFTLTTSGHDPAAVESFLGADEGGDNIVALLLIDADTNKLRAARVIGLPETAVHTIKSAGLAQISRYADNIAVLSVINAVYARMSTEEIVERGETYEFKR